MEFLDTAVLLPAGVLSANEGVSGWGGALPQRAGGTVWHPRPPIPFPMSRPTRLPPGVCPDEAVRWGPSGWDAFALPINPPIQNPSAEIVAGTPVDKSAAEGNHRNHSGKTAMSSELRQGTNRTSLPVFLAHGGQKARNRTATALHSCRTPTPARPFGPVRPDRVARSLPGGRQGGTPAWGRG